MFCLPTHVGVKEAHHDEGPLPAWEFHFHIFASSLNLYPFADLCEAVNNQTLGEMSSPAPSVPWRSGGAAFHDPVPQVDDVTPSSIGHGLQPTGGFKGPTSTLAPT